MINVDYVLEANGYESSTLQASSIIVPDTCEFINLGEFAGYPVYMLTKIVDFTREGVTKRVMIIEPTSIVVNWNMIHEWLDKKIPGFTNPHSGFRKITNCSNFQNIWR